VKSSFVGPLAAAKVKRYAVLVLAGLLSASLAASAQQKVIPLWPEAAPGSENWTQQEQTIYSPQFHTRVVRNVTRPTLTVYPPTAPSNGTAVVVCPGGGFHFLSIDNEGTEVARWLSAHGVTAFVLKYRLLRTSGTPADLFQQTMEDINNRTKMAALMKPYAPLVTADGQQAVRLVRQQARQWKISPNRIGIIGFSAGGWLSVKVALDHDASSRPDFAAAIYPALPDDLRVPQDAPPMFVVCASDDPLVPPLTNSVRLYSLWKLAGIPAELHVFSKGGHGFGMAKHSLPVDHWVDLYGDWLRVQGLLKPAP
jgi:acetyl esterase/lipase